MRVRVQVRAGPALSMQHESRPDEMKPASSWSRNAADTPNVRAIDSRETERYDSRNCVYAITRTCHGMGRAQSTRACSEESEIA